MKLDFDPRKNITKLDYFIMQFDKVNRKIKDLLVVKSIVNNWYDVILFRVGLKKPGFIMWLRNGKKIEIKKPEDYFSFWESDTVFNNRVKILRSKGYQIMLRDKQLQVNNFGKKIKFYFDDAKQVFNILGMIEENFINEQYKELDVVGKDVVDIGANIGDSAIYFALKDARHVYAFEPYPYSYGLAKKNIELNNLNNNITILNAGCGKTAFVTIDTDFKNYACSDLKTSLKGNKVRIYSLDEIAQEFNLKNAVLKIDCEGCEYNIILGAKLETLKRFDQIIIEYHYGYKNLSKELEHAKFRLKHTLPHYSHNTNVANTNMYVGLIYADR
jgi:FkbM family methyltransferase